MAAVDYRVAELLVPGGPLLHDSRLRAGSLGHAAAVVDEHVLDRALLVHVVTPRYFNRVARSAPMIASAEVRRSRWAGSLSQRFWPEGCGSGTITGPSPNFRPTRSSRRPGPRNRAIAICPTRINTFGFKSRSSPSSQRAQVATAAGGGLRSPLPARLRPGKQRMSAAI